MIDPLPSPQSDARSARSISIATLPRRNARRAASASNAGQARRAARRQRRQRRERLDERGRADPGGHRVGIEEERILVAVLAEARRAARKVASPSPSASGPRAQRDPEVGRPVAIPVTPLEEPGQRVEPVPGRGRLPREVFRPGRLAVRVALERDTAVDQHQRRAAQGQGEPPCLPRHLIAVGGHDVREPQGIGGRIGRAWLVPGRRLLRLVLDRRGEPHDGLGQGCQGRRRSGRPAGRPGSTGYQLLAPIWGRSELLGPRPRPLGRRPLPELGRDGHEDPRLADHPDHKLDAGNGRANAPVCESREWQPATPDSPIARSPHLATRIFGIPGNPSTDQLRSTTGPIVRNAGAVGQTGAEFSPDSLGTALRKARRSGAFVRRWGWSGSYGFQEFRAPGPLI